MKKIVIVIFLLIILCGCSSQEQKGKYDDYERVEFIEAMANCKVFNTGVYAVVDITEETVMVGPGEENALVYQIGPNEWILLDKIEGCGYGSPTIHNNSKKTYFYENKEKGENKLYTVRNTDLREYTLSGEKFVKKSLKFDISLIVESSSTGYLESYEIEKVEDDFIYYRATIHSTRKSVFIKCSLENSVCELVANE